MDADGAVLGFDYLPTYLPPSPPPFLPSIKKKLSAKYIRVWTWVRGYLWIL